MRPIHRRMRRTQLTQLTQNHIGESDERIKSGNSLIMFTLPRIRAYRTIRTLETSESTDAPQHHPFDGSDTDFINVPAAPSQSGKLGLLLDDPIDQDISPHGEPEYSDSVNKESTEESVHSSLQDGVQLSFVSDDTHLTDVSMGATHRQVDVLLKEAELHSHESRRHLSTSFNAQAHPFKYSDMTRQSESQGDSVQDDRQDAVAAAFALCKRKPHLRAP